MKRSKEREVKEGKDPEKYAKIISGFVTVVKKVRVCDAIKGTALEFFPSRPVVGTSAEPWGGV